MSYSCTLYVNSSNANVLNKIITSVATVSCDFKNRIDVENPEVYISATASYDKVNYMYIPEFNRYYFCHAGAGTGQTLTYICQSDPLMSFKTAILNSPAVITRNPWHFDKYLPDNKLPIESRTVSQIKKFSNGNVFNGSYNSYVLTVLGSGGN